METMPISEIAALAAECLSVDGGLPMAADDDFVRSRYPEGASSVVIGAFDAGGRTIAYASVLRDGTAQPPQAALFGQVHPDYRGRGVGTFLLRWSREQATSLLADVPGDRQTTLRLATAGLSEDAERLYARHGFSQTFGEDVLRRNLRNPLPQAAFPPGITLVTWSPMLATAFFSTYQAAFRERPGFPNWSEEQWIAWETGDDVFRPDMSLLARLEGQPIGFILCELGWISQVGVRPELRKRGIGSALVVEAMRRFQTAGCPFAWLCVNINNPTAASVYRGLGFDVAGRRARYSRDTEEILL